MREVMPEIKGDVELPAQWTVFAPLKRSDPVIDDDLLRTVPDHLMVNGTKLLPQKLTPIRGQFDFQGMFGGPPDNMEKTAYVYLALHADQAGEATLGLGWDYWLDAWLNGKPLLEKPEANDPNYPPTVADCLLTVALEQGENVLVLRYVSGLGPPILAVAGPRELRAGDFRCIADDMLLNDPDWDQVELRAAAGGKPVADIGTRRELFVDDFLVDGLTGGVTRQLQHPLPREVVMQFAERGMPWEGNIGYPAIVQDGSRILMYYSGRPAKVTDESKDQVTCVAETVDGINFTRPTLGLFDYNGSRENNIVWRGTPSHNFTPFLDSNPASPADQRFKAIAYHPEGRGLGAFGSPDGINWRVLTEDRIITKGGFDSQNLAFWDTLRGHYVAYSRLCRYLPPGRFMGKRRDITICTSEDFIHWTEPRYIEYNDVLEHEMYTNGIRPYYRAPHIYLGLPARFVGCRRKVASHPNPSISDAILMSSRDGVKFDRWREGFIRPGPEPEMWTDRNQYPAWGMLETAPGEISIYWNEHNNHPGMRLRRGTLRTDGFVSLHAGGDDLGEMLTRPLVFSGNRLEINYATSAVGALMFELCDEAGRALPGLAMADSETLYGNELAHTVTWRGRAQDLGGLAGRPVRLRVRLQDADLYSLRFV